MEKNYSAVFSPAEVEFLIDEADEYGWYVWTDRTAPMITALCESRLMAPNGDFKVIYHNDGKRDLLADSVPRRTTTLHRYFELIDDGRAAFKILQRKALFNSKKPISLRRA